MKNYTVRAIFGTYQYLNGNNTTFGGAEMRLANKSGYLGLGASVASDDLKNPYGLLDVKGKLNYDSKGVFEQNIRIRTAFDQDLKSTQIRYSPFTVNIPITEDLSIYSNTNYSGKYNYKADKWTHSINNFTGISWDITTNDNISGEINRYNLQNFRENSKENWSINLFYTHKF